MKVLRKSMVCGPGQAFRYQKDVSFTLPLHFHEEYELIYIVSGNGREYVGDSIVAYQSGDLMLVGSNTPHLHLCESEQNIGGNESRCEILYFQMSVLPVAVEELEECQLLVSLLKDSAFGVKFEDRAVVTEARQLMESIDLCSGMEKLIELYRLLSLLCQCRNKRMVSSSALRLSCPVDFTDEPVDKVCSYLKRHFRDSLRMEMVAGLAGMHPSALCRLFKRKTGRTVFALLNEVRIEYACRLLRHTNLTVSQIAFEVGYNNLSFFNKMFKQIVGQTPTAYRRALGCPR